MATFLIISFSIIILLIWFWRKSPTDKPVENEYSDRIYEDGNYQALKKLFFSVNANNINSEYSNNPRAVYGVLIEAYIKDNKKILFASYITGFAGYYLSKGGGLIGGKWYPENDRTVQQELMQMCDIKNLIGQNQRIETRKMATKLTIRACDFLNHTVPDSSWRETPNTIKFWFLTKEGVYFTEVENSLISNSHLKELVDKGYEIINHLHEA
jgi:hypothetical protein